MGTFTLELNEVLEFTPDIGLNSYPLFDEKYRTGLNQKIIDHFWNREIGVETVSMFRQQMRSRMNNIMPLYNQHYEASRIKFDPLKTIDIQNVATTDATSNTTNHGESESTTAAETASTNHSESDRTTHGETASSSGAKSRSVASDHPQEALSDTGDYASSSNDAISNSSADGSSDETSNQVVNENGTGTADEIGTATTDETGTAVQHAATNAGTSGFQGNAAAVIFQLRSTFVNVDMMIIDELEDLFMLVWNTADDYTGRKGQMRYGNSAYPAY